MSNVLITPLMGLANPVPGVDPGPDYADNLYNSLNIVDGHNHSVGSGNQIGTSGLDINADLAFNSSNATLLRSVRFSAQGSPLALASDLGCLYESGVDLYYNDGNGNQVRITSGGSVNATSSGISSGTATAAFSGGVLVVDSNTNTPANIQCGSVLIGDTTVSPNFVTISAAAALAANYPLVLPAALPGATSFLTLDSSGNLASGVAYSNGITASQLADNCVTTAKINALAVTTAKIADLNVTTGKIADSAVTAVKLAAANSNAVNTGGVVVTAGPTSFATMTFTPSGVRPVLLLVQGNNTSGSYLEAFSDQSQAEALLSLKDGSTVLTTWSVASISGSALAVSTKVRCPLNFSYIYTPSNALRTYSLVLTRSGSGAATTATLSASTFYVTEI